MNGADQLAIRFVFASAGCLAAGLAVWGATWLARRVLPALGMQRSTWLLGQVAIAATFVLPLALPAQQARMQPVFEVDVGAAATRLAEPGRDAGAGMPARTVERRSWLAWLAWAWVLAYAAGLAWMLGRLWRGQRALDRLVRGGAHRVQARGPGIVDVDAPIPPMLVGPFKPRLLLPLSLRDIDPLQRELIVAHELTHWRRGDLWWLAAGAALQALCWFNPVMRRLRAQLSWAQELGCDRDVLRGRPPRERRAYAAALVAQLRMQRAGHHRHHPVGGALAFGGVSPATMAARVELIRAPAAARHPALARGAGCAILALAFGGNLALQPALAWHRHPAALDCTLMLDAASGQRLLEQGDCGVRATPASTFNIAVSLVGYDAGILVDAHTPALPFRQGYADWLPAWRATTDPTGWIRNSTVWYAQQVTTRLGAEALQTYLRRFGYGNQDLSGGVADAWIGSSLQISAQEQAAFLRKVVRRELGLRPHAYDTTAALLRLPTLPNGWDVHAKTGTAVLEPDGAHGPPRSYGWFVGWASKEGRTIVFTRLVLAPQRPGAAAGPRLKEAFLRELPSRLDAL